MKKTLSTFLLIAAAFAAATGLVKLDAIQGVDVSGQTDVLMARNNELLRRETSISYEDSLSLENLESVNWYYRPHEVCESDVSLYAISITFYNKQFLLSLTSNFKILFGQYSIAGNKITCNVEKVFPDPRGILSSVSLDGKSFELEYSFDKADFWYSIKLKHKNNKTIFYAIASISKDDNWYSINNYEVYKYAGGAGVTNGRLNVRENPGTGAKKLFLLEDKKRVLVIGRTRTENTIDGIKSCWYYVDYKYEENICPVYGWVFGGCIKKTEADGEAGSADLTACVITFVKNWRYSTEFPVTSSFFI